MTDKPGQALTAPVAIGVIGCGTIAEKMIDAWRPSMRAARLVAASDVNPARTQRFKERYGVEKIYDDYRALLNDSSVQAVMVLTPNFLHAEQVVAAANAGKHVICQKPLAMNANEARLMIEAAEKNGVTLMAALVKRFSPYYAALKSLIDDGAIGRVIALRSQFSHAGLGKYYTPASDWFHDPKKAGGGPLADLGVHHFDVLRWLAQSEVQSVTADIPPTEAGALEQNVVLNLQFRNGVIGQGFYSFTTVSPPGVALERIEVYGSEGTAITTLAHPGRWVVQYCGATAFAGSLGGWVDAPVVDAGPPFALMLQHFVDSLLAGRPPATTGVDGWRGVEISDAAYRSAREGRRVILEQDPAVR